MILNRLLIVVYLIVLIPTQLKFAVPRLALVEVHHILEMNHLVSLVNLLIIEFDHLLRPTNPSNTCVAPSSRRDDPSASCDVPPTNSSAPVASSDVPALNCCAPVASSLVPVLNCSAPVANFRNPHLTSRTCCYLTCTVC